MMLDGMTAVKFPFVANAPIKYLDDGAGGYLNDGNWHTLDAGTNLILGAEYLVTLELASIDDVGLFHLRSCTLAEQAALVAGDYGVPFSAVFRYPVATTATRLRLSIRRMQGAPNGYKAILSRTDVLV